jgi:hypothetical protein
MVWETQETRETKMTDIKKQDLTPLFENLFHWDQINQINQINEIGLIDENIKIKDLTLSHTFI